MCHISLINSSLSSIEVQFESISKKLKVIL